MIALVQQILLQNRQLLSLKDEREQQLLQVEISTIDKKIDQEVYRLYGLTDQEIKVIEGDT